MNPGLHEASVPELESLWPAARAGNLFASAEAFRAWRDRGPWRVRVNARGDAVLLVPWRAHLDLLAIRALWCAPGRIGDLLPQVREFARSRGFGRLVSPLLAQEAAGPYLRAGMEVRERLVALSGEPGLMQRVGFPEGVVVSAAGPGDVDTVAELEAASFDEFWRHGEVELRDEFETNRAIVARRDGRVVGYTLTGASRDSVTLGRLAVHPATRRQGIGMALLSDVAEFAERTGAAAVTLCTQRSNTGSRALYARCGLRERPGSIVIAVDGESIAGEEGSG